MHNENMMTTVEAAEYVHFSRFTLEKWRVKKEGPKYSLISGKIFYFKDDLDAWVQEHRDNGE